MKSALLIILFSLFFILPARGQDDPMPEGKGRERLEQLRRIKLIEALDLNEDQAVRLAVREKDFRESERMLFVKRKNVIKDLRSQVEEKADDNTLRSQLVKLDEIDAQISHEKHKYLLSLNDFLSMQQIAKIVLFEQHFRQEVRRLLEQAGRPPHR
jgi:hypothetical protein